MSRVSSTSLPYSGRDVMAYPPWKAAAARLVFRLADVFRFWRYPAAIDIEAFGQIGRMLNWFYLAERPATRAERGSGLEAYFAERRRTPAPLLPPGFAAESTLSLSAVGDLMCNPILEASAGRFYARVAPLIFGADVAFANLESTLTSGPIAEPALTEDDLPKINASAAQFDAVKGHGGRTYTVVQTANNHILDCGRDGLDTTHARLDAEGIRYVGTRRPDASPDDGVVVEARGFRLGFVAATWGVNNRPFPAGYEHAVDVVRFHRRRGAPDLSRLERQMDACRAQGCDVVIAGLHWGCEWEFYPRAHQVEQAHWLAERGADIVIGHHAHVIQPMEWYRTQRAPPRWVPILYNLGNLAALLSAPFSALSLVARITLARGRAPGGAPQTLVSGLDLTPVLQTAHTEAAVPYVDLAPLKDLLAAPATPAQTRQARAAAPYADLVLGPGWRA